MISNAFLSALEADLQISRAVLKISQWGVEVKLHRNNKGLFTVALTELIEAASEIEGRPQGEEVITLTCNEPTYQSKGVYCSLQQQQKQTPAAEVAQPQSERDPNFRNSSDLFLGVTSHGAAEGNVSEQGRGDLRHECGTQSRDAPDGPRGSEFELRSRTDRPASTSTRSDQSATMGRDEVAGRQVERTLLCGGVSPRQQVCELHGLSQQAHISMGPELSPICSSSPSSRSQSQGKDDEDRARGTPSTPSGCDSNHGSTPALPSRMGTALHTKVIGPRSEESEQSRTGEEKCHRGGRTDGYATRSGKGDQGGQDGAPCDLTARGGQDSAGDWEQVKGKQDINHRQNSALSISHDLCHQIECAQLSIEKELEKLRTVWSVPTGSRKASPWKLDLLEIYCEENSQLTEQAKRLGLRAKRFTFQDGDLSTSAGRTALWKVILEEKPKEIWVCAGLQVLGPLQSSKHGQKHQHSKQNTRR